MQTLSLATGFHSPSKNTLISYAATKFDYIHIRTFSTVKKEQHRRDKLGKKQSKHNQEQYRRDKLEKKNNQNTSSMISP
jgi:hypothetical protein